MRRVRSERLIGENSLWYEKLSSFRTFRSRVKKKRKKKKSLHFKSDSNTDFVFEKGSRNVYKEKRDVPSDR